MNSPHTLSRHVDYLRIALEQEKKPIGILLGAGAPMALQVDGSPLVPDLARLTEYVLEDVDKISKPDLITLVGHLDEADQTNLEAILNYVRTLASLPGTQSVRGVDKAALSSLDAAICRVIRKRVDVDLPESDNPYLALALWISAVQRLMPVQIFTTNYDLLVEQALERRKVAYFDGFMGSREPTFDIQSIEEDNLPSRWTLLWKLHGSINWRQDEKGEVLRRPADVDDGSSALVYPSHLKYDQSRRQPYLAMMDRLKAFLKKPGAILVSCGFSYRDQHINEVIDQSLRGNPTASVHGLLFGPLGNYGEAIRMAAGLHNLALLANDGAVIGGTRAGWEPQGSVDGIEYVPTCDLGDFERFGALLRQLTGESVIGSDPQDGHDA